MRAFSVGLSFAGSMRKKTGPQMRSCSAGAQADSRAGWKLYECENREKSGRTPGGTNS